ncbi:MAG: hypothetical protein J7521_16350 [Caulobacter sp.]|nr:hypothetical protein [Caulobacter sp.]
MRISFSRLVLAALFLSSLALAQPVQASSVANVHVINIAPNNNGTVVFYVDTARNGLPACATAGGQAWTLSTSNSAGQALLSVLLTALSTGLPIDIGGTGVCDHFPNAESAGFISIHKP